MRVALLFTAMCCYECKTEVNILGYTTVQSKLEYTLLYMQHATCKQADRQTDRQPASLKIS